MVVALDRVGGTLAEVTLTKGEVEVPVGTQHLAAVGTGAHPGLRRGLAGWHAGSTAAQVAPGTALVPGGTVRATASAQLRGLRPAGSALITGAALAHGRGLTETDLPPDTRCVVIAVGARPGIDPAKGGLLLGLDRAESVLGPDGNPLPPILVMQGTRAYLLFAVEPSGSGPVVAGVLGAAREFGVVARTLLELGVEGLIGNIAEANSASSMLTWIGVS
jgi:hypothetical protein